tara:strand:- start:1413 stop:2312 length:900 start_codon:yes stop_codon:yes gene_type:complete
MTRFFYILFFAIIQTQQIPLFDGDIAFSYLKKQCEFGERYPGSQNHIDLKNYLVSFLSDKSDELIVYDHEINHPYNKDQKIILYNILARYNLDSQNRILLMAHWDTREIADKDSNKMNQSKPIIGANDGASGISILMHLSEIFSSYPFNNIGVDLLFVDGEDMGRHGDLEHFSIGTKLFSKTMPKPLPQLAICLDMVADKDPEFKIEYFSYIQAERDVLELWNLANSLGYSEFVYELSQPIYDDHRALFVETGIPSLDIIDFDYPYWHTLEDTVDKCSPYTLGIVGTLVCEYLYRKEHD